MTPSASPSEDKSVSIRFRANRKWRLRQLASVEWLLLAVLAAVAAGLRFYRLGAESFWLDEIGQAVLAQRAGGWWQTIVQSAVHRGNTPLDYLITHWMLNVGKSEAILRTPAVIWGLGTVILLYFVGKRLFTPAAGYLSAMLLALTPLHVYYSQEMRFYSLATFLILASFYMFIQAASGDHIWQWVGLSIVSTLALYSHYYMLFIIVALGLWTLVCRREILKHLTVSFGVSIVLFLPWIYHDIIRVNSINTDPAVFEWSGVPVRFLNGLAIGLDQCSFPCTPMTLVGISFFLAISVILILGAFAFYRSGGRTRDSMLLLFLILLIGVPGTILMDKIGQYFFAIRQIVVFLPYLMLIVGSLLMLAPGRRASIVALVIILLYAVIVFLPLSRMYARQTKEDYRGAAHFLEENMSPGDQLFLKQPAFITYYVPELSQNVYPDSGMSDRGKAVDALIENGDKAWFALWGHRKYEYIPKSTKYEQDSVFNSLRILRIVYLTAKE